MTAKVITFDLQGSVIPQRESLRRDPTRRVEEMTDHYRANYDDRTLIYDAVRLPQSGRILLTAPRQLNLSNAIMSGLRQDGQGVQGLRHRVFPKFEFISFRDKGGDVGIDMPYGFSPIVVRDSLTSQFDGLNAATTLSQNNPIEWITDWAQFHVHHHGLEGLLFFDNDSTAYTLLDLAESLETNTGLKSIAVIGANYLYGPRDGRGGGLDNPMFLQIALLNLARLDAFAKARAVLNADIDELILPLSNESMFDVTARSLKGVIRLAGDYAFSQEVPAGPTDHRWRADPPRVSTGKWCARPRGPLSRMGWYVHQVGGELRRLVKDDPRFSLVHCWSASDSRRTQDLPSRLVKDERLSVALDAAKLTRPKEISA